MELLQINTVPAEYTYLITHETRLFGYRCVCVTLGKAIHRLDLLQKTSHMAQATLLFYCINEYPIYHFFKNHIAAHSLAGLRIYPLLVIACHILYSTYQGTFILLLWHLSGLWFALNLSLAHAICIPAFSIQFERLSEWPSLATYLQSVSFRHGVLYSY